MKYEWNLPVPEPAPIDVTMTFACKWCGEERSIERGIARAHDCAVWHAANDDLDFILGIVSELPK